MKVQWYEYDWTVYVAGNVQASVPLAWTGIPGPASVGMAVPELVSVGNSF